MYHGLWGTGTALLETRMIITYVSCIVHYYRPCKGQLYNHVTKIDIAASWWSRPLEVLVAHAQSALQISIPVLSCTGTVVQCCHFVLGLPQLTWTTSTLLEHHAFTPQTPPAVSPPLVPDPNSVSKHASLVPRPRVWLADKWYTGSHWPWLKPSSRHDITDWLLKLTSWSI